MNLEDRAIERAETDAMSQRENRPFISSYESRGSISRMETQREDGYTGMERHPTALSRIETHRGQHASTVGGTFNSRTISRQSKALPAFGAGKPYPPPLPEREGYVVEFDGPQDPIHAQNWSNMKK